ERVDHQREARAAHALEQQRGAAAGELHGAIGDLGDLEARIALARDAHQLAGRIEPLDERSQRRVHSSLLTFTTNLTTRARTIRGRWSRALRRRARSRARARGRAEPARRAR